MILLELHSVHQNHIKRVSGSNNIVYSKDIILRFQNIPLASQNKVDSRKYDTQPSDSKKITTIQEEKEPNIVRKRKAAKNEMDKNLIKFCNTKNVDFLFTKTPEVSQPKPIKKQKNVKVAVSYDQDGESTASDLLRQLEQQFANSAFSDDDDYGSKLKNDRLQNIINEKSEEITEDQVYNREFNNSSKSSVKPAKVVFKKAANDVSRAERANKMAHFEYIESGLVENHEYPKVKVDYKNKQKNKLYTIVRKKVQTRAISQDNKPISMNPINPPNMNKFSPKRFRRFPRFTIFLNKDQENSYEKENSISLNPQFLNFLMTPERAEIVDKGNFNF